MTSDLRLLYVVFPDQPTAENICRQLIEESLIACANIFSPQVSIYRWQKRIETTSEVAALLKTDQAHVKRAEERYFELHPYEVPCCLFLPVENANASYTQWLKGVLG